MVILSGGDANEDRKLCETNDHRSTVILDPVTLRRLSSQIEKIVEQDVRRRIWLSLIVMGSLNACADERSDLR
jgi:hypothetical protein